MMNMNEQTVGLRPYPAEELTKIRRQLEAQGREVFDMGIGDPWIELWEPIRSAMVQAVRPVSQYPSIRGTGALKTAILGYLQRRLPGVDLQTIDVLPSHGSKEAIFHTALSVVGRGGRRSLVYPDPGYAVYRTSAIFAGGTPVPYELTEGRRFRLEPWLLASEVQSDIAGLWINYPHNPTGAMADRSYLVDLVTWARERDVILLADDCYLDIFDPGLVRDRWPISLLEIETRGVLSFMSLSKRSGMTGYRSGFIAGDRALVNQMITARANFGVAPAEMVQDASVVAWGDDTHVEARRRIFAERVECGFEMLRDLGMMTTKPEATFYLWARLPKGLGDDDVAFVRKLAERGVIASPSQWLSEGVRGYVRFALVDDVQRTRKAFDIVRDFVRGKAS